MPIRNLLIALIFASFNTLSSERSYAAGTGEAGAGDPAASESWRWLEVPLLKPSKEISGTDGSPVSYALCACGKNSKGVVEPICCCAKSASSPHILGTFALAENEGDSHDELDSDPCTVSPPSATYCAEQDPTFPADYEELDCSLFSRHQKS